MPVLLLGSDLSDVVAEGCIPSQLPEGDIDGVWVTNWHIVVEISKIHKPGAIISSHQK
jgi:hypothetical protein